MLRPWSDLELGIVWIALGLMLADQVAKRQGLVELRADLESVSERRREPWTRRRRRSQDKKAYTQRDEVWLNGAVSAVCTLVVAGESLRLGETVLVASGLSVAERPPLKGGDYYLANKHIFLAPTQCA